MNFLDKLERKYGRFCIPNLMLYIMMGNAIVFLTDGLLNMGLSYLIYFEPTLIMRGEVWRIFTWIFLTGNQSPIWFIFFMFLYYSIGRELEYQWGSFKFNVYYLLGTVFSIAGYFIVGSTLITAHYINLSLFLAYAALFPNREFLLYGIIPLKVKYLAALDIAYLLVDFMGGGFGTKMLIIVSLLNFILFFGSMLLNGGRGRQTATQKQFKKQKKQSNSKGGEITQVAFHRCTVCGKTELSHPDTEFRYCSKCNGNYEYCMEHLHNHEHK